MFATVRIRDAQQRFCSVSIDVTKSVGDAAQLAALSAPPALQQCLQNCAFYQAVRDCALCPVGSCVSALRCHEF